MLLSLIFYLLSSDYHNRFPFDSIKKYILSKFYQFPHRYDVTIYVGGASLPNSSAACFMLIAVTATRLPWVYDLCHVTNAPNTIRPIASTIILCLQLFQIWMYVYP